MPSFRREGRTYSNRVRLIATHALASLTQHSRKRERSRLAHTIRAMPPNLDPLWASELLSIEVDVRRLWAGLSFRAIDEAKTELSRLECDGVRDFRWFSDVPSPWRQCPVEEAEAEETADGRVRVRLEFWDTGSGITIEADAVTLHQTAF